MSLRTRTRSTNQPTTTTTSNVQDKDDDSDKPLITQQRSPPPPPTLTQRTLASTAHLANLLPTGTLLAFQLLIPVFSNNGNCDPITQLMTQTLLLILALSCFLACFTDSFKSPDGQIYYGFATFKGLWLFDYQGKDSDLPDFSKYKIRFIDIIHSVVSVLVFGAIALRDKNVLSCFYPQPEHAIQEVLDAVPIGIGLICSMVFVVFPTRRHGIGYPVSSA